MGRISGPYQATLYIGTLNGTTDNGRNIPIWRSPSDYRTRVSAVYLQGKWNANSSHYDTLSLKDDAGSTMFSAALTTTGGTVTGAVAMEASTTAAYLELTEGQEVYLNFSQTGNSQIMYDMSITLIYDLWRVP